MKGSLGALLLVGVGIAVGLSWSVLGPGGPGDSAAASSSGAPVAAEVWTCSMHPQIRMDHKDLCPLCGMDLTPIKADAGGGGGPAEPLSLGSYAQMMARVTTAELQPRELFKEIRTVGRVELDETRVAHIASRVDGRVDQVFADFPGTPVKKGEHLVSIYSPQLYTTQEEFLLSVRHEQRRPTLAGTDADPLLSASSRKRLELWGLTDHQLDELVRRGKAETQLVVHAPLGGTVIEKNIRAGQYVKEGDSLYTIADLKQVWLVLEIYESELSWVRLGQSVAVTLESEPAQPVTGTVSFLEPLLNQDTRTVRVRVILANAEGRFRPGMYAQASLRIPILSDGKPAPTGLEGKYVCPMHPYEIAEEASACKVCGMPLEIVPTPGATEAPEAPSTLFVATAEKQVRPLPVADARPAQPTVLAVPADAVLTTGRRQLVYVEREPGQYHLVEPKLGPRAGDFFPVLEGLAAGDRVVVRGNFLIDSQCQVTGKPSLLYPQGTLGEEADQGGNERAKEPSAKELANIDKLPPDESALARAQRVCPVTGALLGSMGRPYKTMLGERAVFLCCKGCEGAVQKDPEGMLKKLDESSGAHAPGQPSAEERTNIDKLPPDERELALAQRVCPVTGEPLGSMGVPCKMKVGERVIFLCCEGCEGAVQEDPVGMLKKLDQSAGTKRPGQENKVR
jgi:Cu(I)/Ag(I) efflux system membrane fusion protein